MMTIALTMPLCWMAVNGFSMSGIRSVPSTTQTRKSGVSAISRPNTASLMIADPTLLESIPKLKRTAEENDKMEEDAVDEYLEFLDRRYRRLHDKESKVVSSQIKAASFSALNWLKQEQWTDSIISQQIQDDALYVLGVAGLASKRLLHKHHIRESFINPTGRSMTLDAIDVASSSANTASDESASESASSGTVTQQGKTTWEIENIFTRVTAARRALITYQTRKLLAAMKAVLNTPWTLIKNIWAIGGGKRSFAIAVTLASILTIALVRPLLIGLGKASLNIVRSS